ncbi:MAG: ABC transporter ATP-binding protein [Lachnospiraceae bacterium]|nr:ABC transporter ATP-binding protein [Lachnospiraceae bacterium]
MEKLLTIKNLVKKYQEGPLESVVVNKVSLEVIPGEFVIVMGASGSGKTSLLHLIAGIDVPDGGTICYHQTKEFGHMSETTRAMFRRKNIGIVFQQQCLIPDLSVYENIMLPVMLGGSRAEKAAMKDTILALCQQFGLQDHTRKYPSQLSGGQQQRTAILRAVVNRPPLLLCDEPTGSLNSAQSEIVMELLTQLNQKGQTIILVTHDRKVAVRGQRVVYMADGQVAGQLTFAGDEPVDLREEELTHFLQQRGW